MNKIPVGQTIAKTYRFAFGDLSLDESSRSLALFVSDLMPRLKGMTTGATKT